MTTEQLISEIQQEINPTGKLGLKIGALAARLIKANNLVNQLGDELVKAHNSWGDGQRANFIANVVSMHQQLDQ
jgi:hypothetical protein